MARQQGQAESGEDALAGAFQRGKLQSLREMCALLLEMFLDRLARARARLADQQRPGFQILQ
ncbi:hypothetical protein D3C81_1782630 [compost metagenome]